MDTWTLVALEEYKTLRTESLQALQNQHSALRLGALTLGFLLGSAFTLIESYTFIACIELTLFSPLIILLVALNWAGELVRMIRVGNYIFALEKKINSSVGQDALNWEQWLRTGGKQIRVSYLAPVGAFFIMGILCIVWGDYIWYLEIGKLSRAIVAANIVGLASILGATFGTGCWLYKVSKSIPEQKSSRRGHKILK